MSGGRVANLSIATDESYFDKSGQKVDRTEWHRIVTFQDGLIDMLERHAKKGRLVHAEGKLQTRRWKKDGEDSDRFSTEILIVPGHKIQFLDKPAGANGNGAQAEPPRRTARRCRPAAPRAGRRFRHGNPLLSRFHSSLPTRAAVSAVAHFLPCAVESPSHRASRGRRRGHRAVGWRRRKAENGQAVQREGGSP